MLEVLKPLYNAALMPIAGVLAKLKIHPNVITTIGLAISCIVGWFAALGKWKPAALFILAGACMDGLDGLVARTYNKKSAFGAIFDSAADRLSEIFWLMGILFFFVSRMSWGVAPIYFCFAAITGALTVSYVRARCEGENIPCTKGILQRPERTIILIGCFIGGPRIMIGGLAVIAVLAYVTVIQRLIIAYSISTRENTRSTL
jgi:CDP-diacylglycerol--glycerol-3-phosphate 3-phosphatidyltransferase